MTGKKINARNRRVKGERKISQVMESKREIYFPYFNNTEKKIIYSALAEAADYLCAFYCFAPREWFNYCYDIKTGLDPNIDFVNKNTFAEVRQYTPILKNSSMFPKERYQICLFDRNILGALWKHPELEFYPFMVYILTHELIHIARFCQNFHPFECDGESLQKEEQRVNRLTQQVLNVKKSNLFNRINFLYKKITPSTPSVPKAVSFAR